MSFLQHLPSEVRAPELKVLSDGRKRITRFYAVAQAGILPPQLDTAWGTADAATAPTGWTGLRLVNRDMIDDVPAPGRDRRPLVVLVYEQIDATGETTVGSRITTKLEDGRTALVDNFVQFSTGTYVPQTVGSSTATGDTSAFLLKEEAPDDGTVRRITRTYVYAGLLQQHDFLRGTLKFRTLVWAKTAPSTPSGYVSVYEQEIKNPSGYPIYTYTFVKVSDGGYSVQRYVDHTLPGRAKAYKYTYNTGSKDRYLLDVFTSPPVTIKVLATISVAYSTTATISAPGDLWNPTGWAVMVAKWVGWGNAPHSEIRALAGYRSVTEDAVTQAADTVAPADVSIMGQPVFGGTTAHLQVLGGPANPDAATYTLDVYMDPEPAFLDAAGTKYYRHTTVVATMPTQPALPV